MDRQDFADDFMVDTLHLNRLQDDIEADRRRLLADLLGVGIAHGLTLSQLPSPGLALRVAPGVAYTPAGRRIEVAVALDVDLTEDYLGASTAPSSGQERYLALYLRPTRVTSESWTDTFGVVRQIRAVEGYEARVVAGASAAPGLAVVPAAVHADDVLLGRVLRASGTTAFYSIDVRLSDVVRAARAADVHAESVERDFEVVPTDPPGLSVLVSAGSYRRNGVRMTHVAQTVGPFSLPSSGMSRVDLVYSAGGVLAIRAGTPFATGSTVLYPDTRNAFPIAFVALDAGQPAILPEHILDARPFLDVTTTHARTHRAVMSLAQVMVPLPWAYETGQGAIRVYLDGVRLDPTQFTEGDPTRVDLNTPAAGGEVVFVESLDLPDPTARMPLERIDDDLSGELAWRGCFTADRTGQKIVVPPIRCCIIDRVRRFTTAEVEVVAAGLASSTIHCLYAKPFGATGLEFEVTTTPPEPTGHWKTGTTTHRYLATFVTNGSGRSLDFRKTATGFHHWRLGDPDTLAFCSLNLVGGGAWNTEFAGALASVPAQVLRGELRATPGAGGELVGIRAYGGTGDGVTLESDGTEHLRLTVDVELDPIGRFEARATAGSPQFILHGYQE